MEEMRRIFAFAYSKTGNTCDAEDLSQDILLEILRSDPARAQNRQAWINGICRHVWSQYLKRNKPHWQAVGNEPAMEYLPAGDDAAIDAERNMEYDRLRQEIAYLSRTRRKVLAMYYFDNMSVEDIAVELEISAATVRWHMSRARSDLKERLDMENRNGIREKIRLLVSAAGDVKDSTLCGLRTELLTQNIAWICYGRDRTTEEIARELGVPAVYIEHIVERLADMEYLRKVSGRYSANFFIWNEEYQIAHLRYYCKHVPRLVEELFEAAINALPEVRRLGFIGCRMPDNELAAHIVTDIAEFIWKSTADKVKSELHLNYETPLHSDGSRHWVSARKPLSQTDDPEVNELMSGGLQGMKGSSAQPVDGMEYRFVLVGEHDGFRGDDLAKLKYITNGEGQFIDKETMASFIRDGFITLKDGGYEVCVPYMTRSQHDEYLKIISNVVGEEMAKHIYDCFSGYAREMRQRLPKFIDKNEQNMRMMGFENFAPVMYYLMKRMNSWLTQQYDRRIFAIVWEAR